MAMKTICVTGASGFVGSRIVADLLERGDRVRATVRDPSKEKYGFLKELAGAEERLTLHAGRLLEEGSFQEAMEGCDGCIHTASPYAIDVADPQRDLVDPAVQGTENVLNEAYRAGIRKVVVTSSMAAITDEPDPEKVLTEEDWNEKSSLTRNPYYLSKAEAERAAWALAKDREGLHLVVINPYVIMGPSLCPSLNTSTGILVDLLTGKYPGKVDINWGIVDVRDVSKAHLLALDKEEAEGRFICVDHLAPMGWVVDTLREAGYGEGFKLPKMDLSGSIGTGMVKLLSYAQPKGTGSYLRTHLGRVPRFDSTKSKEVLGLAYMSLEETLVDTVEDLFGWGHLERPGAR